MQDSQDHHEQEAQQDRPRRRPDFDPIIAGKFWRNRSGEAVVVTVKSYKGRAFVDVRLFYTDRDGKLSPTRKGVAVPILRLLELRAAINKAVEVARAKRLLPAEGAR